jgi:hypothetical protein
VDKKSALENLDLIFMTLDELVDGGCVGLAAYSALVRSTKASLSSVVPSDARAHTRSPRNSIILETDPSVIASRVSMRGGDGELPLSEQTFSQALQSAKEQLARSLLS